MQTCPICHASVVENTRFCMSCGAVLTPGTVVTETVPPLGGEPAAPILAAPARVPASPAQDTRSTPRISSRTVAIAGLLLCLLFFAPFVSCGPQTFTGVQVVQASTSQGQYDQPKDGLLLILLPIAGIVGMIAGWKAMQRVDSGAPLAALRSLATAALLAALVTSFPIGIVIVDVNRASGLVRLEWGFWASALSAVAMGVGAMGLLRAKDDGM